ncbi:hypothetical protein LIA77_08614 [Sarocladium implicatum]|nr:hypothetical protein LIA77_08614 [Sarocladium implicatum]
MTRAASRALIHYAYFDRIAKSAFRVTLLLSIVNSKRRHLRERFLDSPSSSCHRFLRLVSSTFVSGSRRMAWFVSALVSSIQGKSDRTGPSFCSGLLGVGRTRKVPSLQLARSFSHADSLCSSQASLTLSSLSACQPTPRSSFFEDCF